MAPPKRKSPEKKSIRKKGPSIASRMLDRGVSAIARHPRMLGGVATFGVVFSFVAANALWYQPKHHPAPLLATRMFENEVLNNRKSRSESVEEAITEPGVTTFRIERQVDSPVKNVPADPVKPVASPLVQQVQKALAARGLYDGPADGLTGPRTVSAILFFQETEGLEQTGDVSQALLAKIKSLSSAVAVIPDERPSPDVTASTKKSDDVAELIREAETRPLVKTRSVKSEPMDTAGDTLPVEKVMKIQKALSKFAYANVTVDGVAGAATRAAIRSFEKNYNLPITGEPSERVLKKLKSIGAL